MALLRRPADSGDDHRRHDRHPIENVVLEVKWNKTIYGLIHQQTVLLKKMYVATDDSGVFRIPGHSSIHLFSRFADVSWTARHPLHSTVELGMGRKMIDAISHLGKKVDENGPAGYRRASLDPSGEIIFDFSLQSLMEKFRDDLR